MRFVASLVLALLIGLMSPLSANATDAVRGGQIFTTNCAACHAGGGNITTNLNKNAFGLSPAGALQVPPVQPGATGTTSLPLSASPAAATPALRPNQPQPQVDDCTPPPLRPRPTQAQPTQPLAGT